MLRWELGSDRLLRCCVSVSCGVLHVLVKQSLAPRVLGWGDALRVVRARLHAEEQARRK